MALEASPAESDGCMVGFQDEQGVRVRKQLTIMTTDRYFHEHAAVTCDGTHDHVPFRFHCWVQGNWRRNPDTLRPSLLEGLCRSGPGKDHRTSAQMLPFFVSFMSFSKISVPSSNKTLRCHHSQRSKQQAVSPQGPFRQLRRTARERSPCSKR